MKTLMLRSKTMKKYLVILMLLVVTSGLFAADGDMYLIFKIPKAKVPAFKKAMLESMPAVPMIPDPDKAGARIPKYTVRRQIMNWIWSKIKRMEELGNKRITAKSVHYDPNTIEIVDDPNLIP